MVRTFVGANTDFTTQTCVSLVTEASTVQAHTVTGTVGWTSDVGATLARKTFGTMASKINGTNAVVGTVQWATFDVAGSTRKVVVAFAGTCVATSMIAAFVGAGFAQTRSTGKTRIAMAFATHAFTFFIATVGATRDVVFNKCPTVGRAGRVAATFAFEPSVALTVAMHHAFAHLFFFAFPVSCTGGVVVRGANTFTARITRPSQGTLADAIAVAVATVVTRFGAGVDFTTGTCTARVTQASAIVLAFTVVGAIVRFTRFFSASGSSP